MEIKDIRNKVLQVLEIEEIKSVKGFGKIRTQVDMFLAKIDPRYVLESNYRIKHFKALQKNRKKTRMCRKSSKKRPYSKIKLRETKLEKQNSRQSRRKKWKR